jgi:hypothetical protein
VDSWFELLIPIIVVILYLMNRMRGGGDELESPPRDDSEADEEARRIQEEIRRKIVARQQGREMEETEQPESEGPVYSSREAEPQRFERYDSPSEAPVSESFRSRTEVVTPTAVPAAFGSGGDRDYQAELQEQLARVQEAKKARQQATRVARETARTQSATSGLGGVGFRHTSGQVQRRYRNYPVSQVQQELFNRDGLKKAFVLKEVLGPPLSLRPSGDSHAELSRD